MSLAVCRVGVAALVLALLSGCVWTSMYPEHWAERVETQGGDCPDIDGEYLNQGEYFEDVADGGIARYTATLGSIACPGCSQQEFEEGSSFTPMTETYERFRLELEGEVLVMTAIAADGATWRHEVPVRTKCSGSLLEVESGWYSSLEDEGGWEMFGYTLGMSVLARGSSKFGRAADGSLLVRQSEVGSLMVLQWPVFPMANARWIRFPAAASELQAGSDRQAGIPP